MDDIISEPENHESHEAVPHEDKPASHEHGHPAHAEQKIHGKRNLENVIIIFAAVVGIIVLVNLIISTVTLNRLTEKVNELKELAKPVDINLIAIKDKTCNGCFDISPTIDFVKKSNVKIKSEETLEFGTEKAKAIIEKYSISRLPAVIAEGNASRLDFLKPQFETKESALVFNRALAPYTDTATGKVKGKVSVTKLTDSSCSKCSNVEQWVLQLKQGGIAVSSERSVDISSDEGRALLSKYNIRKAPTIILSGDAGEYEVIKKAWSQLGIVADDGSYVLVVINPPYRDILSNEISGLVEMTYLTDKSCKECYNVSEHRIIVTNPQVFNIVLSKETYIDISESEGKEIISRYNVTLVPTILLSKEAGLYPTLLQVWPEVGTIDKDGTFIFRNVQVMQGHYKDLIKNEVVASQSAE